MTISDEEYKANLENATLTELRILCYSKHKVNQSLQWKVDKLWEIIREKDKEIGNLVFTAQKLAAQKRGLLDKIEKIEKTAKEQIAKIEKH